MPGGRLLACGPVDTALLLIRIALGTVFLAYGAQKWAGGMDRFAGLLMTIRIPFPEVTARGFALLETVGGALLLLGLWTRPVAALLACEMVVAIVRVVWPRGFVGGFAFEFVLLCTALALAIAGGGRIGLGRGCLERTD